MSCKWLLKVPTLTSHWFLNGESWMDGTVVQIDDQYNIINFINKKAFSYRDAETYYKTVNIYKFSKEFAKQKYIPFLNAYCEAQGIMNITNKYCV